MTRVFTPATIAEITRRAREGASARTIARELGLNLSSLRVKCSQLGISLRKCRASRVVDAIQAPADRSPRDIQSIRTPIAPPRASTPGGRTPSIPSTAELDPHAITAAESMRVVVPRLTLHRLRQWGAAKGVTADTLAAQLLTVIANESLCNAILDDDAA